MGVTGIQTARRLLFAWGDVFEHSGQIDGIVPAYFGC